MIHNFKPGQLAGLLGGAAAEAREALGTLTALALDPQEVHLSASLILTSPSQPAEAQEEADESGWGFPGLAELYRLRLLNHETAFHPQGPLRCAQILLLVQSLRELSGEALSPALVAQATHFISALSSTPPNPNLSNSVSLPPP